MKTPPLRALVCAATVAAAAFVPVTAFAAPGSIGFATTSASVAESGGSLIISVSRTGGTDAVGVNYATSNGSAVSTADYTAQGGTLTWANGDAAAKTITVPISADALTEGNESFTVTLSSPTGGATLTGGASVMTVTINDGPIIGLSSANVAVSESAGSVVITAQRVGSSTGAVSASFAINPGTATANVDYTRSPLSGSVTWADGDTTDKSISVDITEDTVRENTAETFTVSLSAPTGSASLGNASTTVSISDNDGGSPELASNSGGGAYSFGDTITLTANFTGGTSQLGADPVFTWTRDGTTIVNGGRYAQSVSSPNGSNTSTATLVITDAKSVDAGTYTFAMTNVNGAFSASFPAVTVTQVATSRDPATASLTATAAPTAFLTLPNGSTLMAVGGNVAGASSTSAPSNSNLVVVQLDGRVSATPAGQFNATVSALHLLDDGKVLVLGNFTQVAGSGGAGRAFLARLNADLTLDDSFVPSPMPTIGPDRLITDQAGRIYLGGQFNNYAGVTGYNNLVRLYADGTLDRSFVRAPNGEVNALLRQTDGKIVIVGKFATLLGDNLEVDGLYRLDADGTLDITFTPPAYPTTDVQYETAALDSVGRIVLSRLGTNNLITRLLSTGVEDDAFNLTATFNKNVTGLLVGSGDSILAVGNFDTVTTPEGAISYGRILRLRADGSFDDAFNNVLEPTTSDVALNGNVSAAHLAPTGRIWLGGIFTSTDSDWLGTATRVLVLQGDAPNVGFVAAPTGEVYTDGATLQFHVSSTGRNGTTFQWQKNGNPLADGGRVSGATSSSLFITNANSTDEAEYSVVIDTGDETQISPTIVAERIGAPIIISSSADQIKDLGSTVTFTADVRGSGTLTHAWFRDGVVLANGVDSGGAIVSGASTSTLTITGLTANQAGLYTLTVTGLGSVSSSPAMLTIERRPGALASNVSDVVMPAITASNHVNAILRLADGSLLVGGAFTSISSGGTTYTRNRIARFLPTGEIDASFAPFFSDTIYALAQDAAGRIFVGGDFTSVNFGGSAVTRNRVARLTSALALDTAFDTSTAGPSNNNVYALAPVGDGSVYVGGSFTTFIGASSGASYMALLAANGSHEASFISAANNTVNSILRLTDGSLIVGGLSTTWSTSAPANLVKLSSNGARLTFSSPANGTNVSSLLLLADGSLLVGGAGAHVSRVSTVDGAATDPALTIPGHTGLVSAFAQESGGKLISGSGGVLKRTSAEGVADSGFDQFDSQIRAIAVDASGRIWVGGSFNTYAGQPSKGIAVLAGGSTSTFTGSIASQTITFPAIAGGQYDPDADPIILAATASSGLPVTYSVSGPATVDGHTLTITGAGNVTVTATQSGGSGFSSASATRSFTVQRATQTITFGELPTRLVSAVSFALTATIDSGLPLTYQIAGPATLATDAETGIVSVILGTPLNGAETVTITATQAGNDNYMPAEPKAQSFLLRSAGITTQTINFPQPGVRTYQVTPAATLNATASPSRLPVTFTVVSGPGLIGDDGRTLSTTGAGSIVVRATQAGNETYAAATPVERTIVVNKAPQAITFNLPTTISLSTATTLNLSATASSDLDVVYDQPVGPATLEGNVLTFTGSGKVTIVARQAGDANFNAASAITRAITVTAPVLTLSNLKQVYDGTRRAVTLTGLPEGVTATVVYGSSTYPTSELAPIDAGTYTVIATLSGGGAKTTKKLVISKRPVRIRPVDQVRRVGTDLTGEVFPLTYSAVAGNNDSGFIVGDDETDLDTLPTARATSNRTSRAGDYFIIPGGAADTNYSFVYERGNLTLVGLGGAYQALLVDLDATNPKPVGLLTLTMLNNSFGYTGSLILADESAGISLRSGAADSLNPPLTGNNEEAVVDATGTIIREAVAATTKSPRRPKLEFVVSVSSTGVLTGTLAVDDEPFAVLANGRALRTTKSSVGVGSYTMAISPPSILEGADEPAAGEIPEGWGHATGSISTAGLLRLSGRLPDGTTLTASLQADVDGHYRMFTKPYGSAVNRNGSYLGGLLQTEAHPTASNLLRVPQASLLWNKVGISTEPTYSDGFGPLQAAVAMEAWQRPTTANRLPMLLGLTEISSESGDFSLEFDNSLFTTEQTELLATVASRTMLPAGSIATVATAENPSGFSLTVTSATGAFSGSMRLPLAPTDAVRTVRFTGVLMQVPGSETNASVIGAGQFQMPVSVAGETEGSTTTISVFGGMMLTKPVIQIQ